MLLIVQELHLPGRDLAFSRADVRHHLSAPGDVFFDKKRQLAV